MSLTHLFKRFNWFVLTTTFLFVAPQKIGAAPCPCDIYKDAGTPCVAAHSTVRALFESYNGPLYQVRRTSDNATLNIGVTSVGGFANTASQDSFLNGKPGTISIIYDQTSYHNDLVKSGKATWLKNGGVEANAADGKILVNGHTVHGIYVTAYSNVAYRNNATTAVATKDQAESMYMVVDGKRYSNQCCFDYGNAETSGIDDGNGTMEAVYFGNDITWGGKGDGNGPWVAADLENGVFKSDQGGWQSQSLSIPTAKSIIANYASVFLKGPSGNHFGLKAGNAQSGKLTTMWDGNRPNKYPAYSPKQLKGAIILGTGGDGSNAGTGTFFEGAMTSGNPPDSIDDKIQANIVDAGYGRTITSTRFYNINKVNNSAFDIRYNPSTANVIISYTLPEVRHVSMTVFDQQGRLITTIVNGIQTEGQHEAVWDANRVPVGIYVANVTIDGHQKWAGKINIGK